MSGQHFRIFVSSPGDVPDERAIAASVIENLPYDPAFCDQITVEQLAWERPGASPMEANITPQEAINAGLPLPADCDIVVMIVRATMGTPLIVDGIAYRSGTEFEYRNAMESAVFQGKPRVLVYRRDVKDLTVNVNDPLFMEKFQQFKWVREFFKHEFDDKDLARQRDGYQKYKTPDDFRYLLESNLKSTIQDILKRQTSDAQVTEMTEKPTFWKGSPYPGLRAFTPEDERLFFGRGHETDKLTRRVRTSQFVAIVGASGIGKSSLVGAGLIPRLMKTSASGKWQVLSFEPDNERSGNPFVSLASALQIQMGIDEQDLAEKLENEANFLNKLINKTLETPETKLLLFIDQFEELFTTIDPSMLDAFIKMLKKTMANERIHLVISLQSDFYPNCIARPDFAEMLDGNTFPLASPKLQALQEMIERPTERAGLRFEAGLVQKILEDTGDGADSLTLMACLLDGLYQLRTEDGVLTSHAYKNLGEVQGSVDRRFEYIFAKLNKQQQRVIPYIFRELIDIKNDGSVIRKRAGYSKFVSDDNARESLKALASAQLVLVNRGKTKEPYIELTHDSLLRTWRHLAELIELMKEDHQLFQQLRQAAAEWHQQGRPQHLLWQHEQLKPVYQMRQRLNKRFSERLETFVEPETHRLLHDFVKCRMDCSQDAAFCQMSIAYRLLQIGVEAEPSMILALDYALDSTVSRILSKGLKSLQSINIDEVELAQLTAKIPPLEEIKHKEQQQMPVEEPVPHVENERQFVLEQLYAESASKKVASNGHGSHPAKDKKRETIEALIHKATQEDIHKAITQEFQSLQATKDVVIVENIRKARDENIRKAQEIMGGKDSLSRRIRERKEKARREIQEIRSQFEDLINLYTTGAYAKQNVLHKLMERATTQKVDASVSESLFILLHDEDYIMRYRAALALSGNDEAIVLLGLVQALKDEHKGVRKTVLEILGKNWRVLALVFIVESLDNDPNLSVQRTAALALRQFYGEVQAQPV